MGAIIVIRGAFRRDRRGLAGRLASGRLALMSMAMQPDQGFGWSLPLRGRAPDGIARELKGVRRQVESLVSAYFPAAEGYVFERVDSPNSSTLGGFEHFGVVIDRGDFRAEIAFEHLSPRVEGAPAWVRLCGSSQSRVLVRARRVGIGLAETLRWVVGSLGIAAVVVMLSLLALSPPHFSVETLFVLGGLLMVVVAVLTVAAAVAIGAWFGGQVGAVLLLRAQRQVAADDQLRKDILRWASLTRQMMAMRGLLAGDLRRQPFRHERENWMPPREASRVTSASL